MKIIKERGRTIDAVLNPKKYPAFSKISDQNAFDALWASNRDCVFANMAHAAYCDNNYTKKLLDKFGVKDVKFYKSQPNNHGIIRGREAFLAIWENKAILSFRGTEGTDQLRIKVSDKVISFFKKYLKINIPLEIKTFIPTDIIDDIKFFQFTYSEAGGESKIHGGFYHATNELWPEIKNDLENLNLSDSTQLYVTGHSLGAAMALIAAMFYSFKEVVTFGEPCVGNDIDKTLENCPHTRYVNGNDPVTKIVPKVIYKHHGDEIKIQDSSGSDIRYDHSIINYADILGRSTSMRILS